jgi:hypothetical protein
MTPHPDDPVLPVAIESRQDFVAAVHATVAAALARRSRQMLWVDQDFADWPLDDAALLDALTRWLRLPQRRLVLLATQFDDVSRRCSRFVGWYRLWAHAVQASSPLPGDAIELPCLLIAEEAGLVQLLDKAHWHGRTSLEGSEIRQWQNVATTWLQRCEPAFPATTLGL